MLTLAFYRGRGGVFDRLVRLWTGSIYSHVELVERLIAPGEWAVGWSSSPLDGGVRAKAICFDPDEWELVPVDFAPDDAVGKISLHQGARYDWLGVLLSQILPLQRHGKSRWFCSEIVAHAIGLPNAHPYSPARLKASVDRRHSALRQGAIFARRERRIRALMPNGAAEWPR